MAVEPQAPPAGWTSNGLLRADGFEGARLVLVSTQRQSRLLSQGFVSACDPNVSFDGLRLVFAGKKDPGSRWRIWEMGIDGENVKAISPENQDARQPIHACTLFTLESPEPWFTIVYSAREGAELGPPGGPKANLYSIKLNGRELRRLTFNPWHNSDPFQMWDGRVIYAGERQALEPGGAPGRVGLHAIHVEGADMEFYGGGQGGRIQHMPCATERGQVVFVEAAAGRWDGAGQLAGVHESRPHLTYRRLTDDPAWVYLHPSPWKDSLLLVARRPAKGAGVWEAGVFDTETRRFETVFASPGRHVAQAVSVRPRPRPDGHSTVVDPKYDTGIFYGLNCYDADAALGPHLRTGMVKRVRFIEGILPSAGGAPSKAGSETLATARRLVGEAPVEADGSFNVETPADTPLLVQTLDERGLALATCGWVWVKPREKRGCIGCHEDPERIPENEYVLALRRPSNRLALPPDQRRTVTFRDDIAPLLKEHCATADCHGGPDTPLAMPLTAAPPSEESLRRTYQALLAPRDGSNPEEGKYVDAGRARTSWLIWQVFGADTSRPWDRKPGTAASAARKTTPMPPAGKGKPLRAEDLRTLAQWIDLGAPYDFPQGSGKPKLAQNP